MKKKKYLEIKIIFKKYIDKVAISTLLRALKLFVRRGELKYMEGRTFYNYFIIFQNIIIYIKNLFKNGSIILKVIKSSNNIFTCNLETYIENEKIIKIKKAYLKILKEKGIKFEENYNFFVEQMEKNNGLLSHNKSYQEEEFKRYMKKIVEGKREFESKIWFPIEEEVEYSMSEEMEKYIDEEIEKLRQIYEPDEEQVNHENAAIPNKIEKKLDNIILEKKHKQFTKFQKVRHFFHIVDSSPWPYLVSVFVSTTGLSLIASMQYSLNWNIAYVQILFFFFSVFLWFRDITREAVFESQHTKDVQRNIKLGMALFIISEVMFFFSFFWAFFHVSLAPSVEIGGIWPPSALNLFNPFTIPLLNTAILLLSGCSLTWVHFCIIQEEEEVLNEEDLFYEEKVLAREEEKMFDSKDEKEEKKFRKKVFNFSDKSFFNIQLIIVKYKKRELSIRIGFILTLLLSFFFTGLQFLEYKNAPFSISDSVYGSAFFLMTGFHGFHVIVGTIFIMVCFFFFINNYVTSEFHVSFECAAWYWHFVDVVWLFLFVSIYWWGSWI